MRYEESDLVVNYDTFQFGLDSDEADYSEEDVLVMPTLNFQSNSIEITKHTHDSWFDDYENEDDDAETLRMPSMDFSHELRSITERFAVENQHSDDDDLLIPPKLF